MFLLAIEKAKEHYFFTTDTQIVSGYFFSLTHIPLLLSKRLLGGSTKNEKINIHWEPVRNNIPQKATVHLSSCTTGEGTVKIVMISKRWPTLAFFAVVSREVDMFRRKPTEARSTVCTAVSLSLAKATCASRGQGGWGAEGCSSPKPLGNRIFHHPECHQQNSCWCYREVKGKQGALSTCIQLVMDVSCVTFIPHKSTENVSKVGKNQPEEIAKGLHWSKVSTGKCKVKNIVVKNISPHHLWSKNIKNEDFTLEEQTFRQIMLMVWIILWFEL